MGPRRKDMNGGGAGGGDEETGGASSSQRHGVGHRRYPKAKQRRRPPPAQTSSSSSSRPAPSPSSASVAASAAAASQFNPRLILAQIVALQCFHYAFLGLIFQINHALFGTSVTVDRIFTSRYVGLRSAEGWVDGGAVLLNSAIGAVLLAVIVEKSKKCLDFSVTLFFVHFVACASYGGIPSTWDWWIVHVAGTVLTIVLGEYLCSLREMAEIPLLDL